MEEEDKKRECFGTTEFSDKSCICKACKHFYQCKEYKPKKRANGISTDLNM